MDFEDMYEGYEQAHERHLWEQAYWVANMMSVHTKHGVRADKLMKPFIKPKSAAQKNSEAEQFFADFQRQREEAKRGG